jgi:hypothetical protein
MGNTISAAAPVPQGNPIAVTLLEKPFFDLMARAATTAGMCMPTPTPQAIWPFFPATECFLPLGLAPQEENEVPVLIVNGLPSALKRTAYLDVHSYQTQFPTKCYAPGGTDFEPDVIPGTRAHPNKAGVTLYGAGAYCFQRSSGVFWNDGAMAFSDEAGTFKLAVAWSCEPGTGYAAVTTDLSPYNASLQTFYDQTVSGNSNILSSAGQGYKVDVSTGTFSLLLTNPNPSGNKSDSYDLTFLTLCVRPE